MQLAYPTRTLVHDCTCVPFLSCRSKYQSTIVPDSGHNCTLLACRRTYINREGLVAGPEFAPTPRNKILNSRLPPCNAIAEGRPPLSNTSSEAGALPLEVRIENDSDQKFSKSQFFHSFLETTFLHVSCFPVIVKIRFVFISLKKGSNSNVP